MTDRPVEAIWFYRYTKGPFRALYGRFGGTLYTKDFLQTSNECLDTMTAAFGMPTGGQVSIEYQWPGGSSPGTIREASGSAGARRIHLAWPTNQKPVPWTLTTSPDPLRAIPGDPSKTTEAAAEDVLRNLENENLDPWIVGVKLADEPGVMHVRSYLGRPPAGYESAGVSNLPLVVQRAMSVVPGGSCGVVVSGPAMQVRATAIVEQVQSALNRSPNVLLVGPPGTGKTVALEDLRRMYEMGATSLLFDPTKGYDAWPIWSTRDRRVISVVFHPSYSYEEFVIGLVPRPGATFALEARPGPLLALAHWAQDPGREALLVIDEFNRGNAAAIFGDTLALLDKEKRDDPAIGQVGASVARAYPREPSVEIPAEYANSTGTRVPRELKLPSSLKIVAALNSSDRSVAPLDAALRRRFGILPVEPNYEVLAERLGRPVVPASFAPLADPATWTRDEAADVAVAMLRSLNKRLGALLGEDFVLGHASLWNVAGDTAEEVVRSLAAAFDEQIAGTLRMTFADQDDQLAGVLKTPPAAAAGAGSLSRWEQPDPALTGLAEPRVRIAKVSDLPWVEAANVLSALI